MNPRDTGANMNRRRMIRRGATYGPALPEDAPDDGVDRGIAAFIICANLNRQFEFAQNVWINDRTFHELGNDHERLGISEALDRSPLGINAEARALLSLRGNSKICDSAVH